MLVEPPDPRSGHPWNRGYRAAIAPYTEALTAMVQQVAAAEVGGDAADTAERLELLRVQLHREVDDAIDAEAVQHPSPLRIVFRARRYYQESA